MKRFVVYLSLFLLALSSFVTLTSFMDGALEAGSDYNIIEIVAVEGWENYPEGINDLGQVIVRSFSGYSDEEYFSFLWETGVVTNLGSLGFRTYCNDINNSAQVVGTSALEWESNFHAYLWENGVMTDLGTFGGDSSGASGINDCGQVVGAYRLHGETMGHAYLWENGVTTDLESLGGGESNAGAINNHGQVVGSSRTEVGDCHACIWENDIITDLGTLGGDSSSAKAINNRGQVVGISNTEAGDWHAFIWENGVMIDLGTFGRNKSSAFGINDLGQIIGYSQTFGEESQPFLWENGVMIDLNDLIPSESGWVLGDVSSINNVGQIVGYGDYNGKRSGFLLTPVPEIMIDNILAFFDESVEQGTLVGRGKRPRLANLRLKWMRKMIEKAGDFIERGRIRAACRMLQNAYKRCDGKRWPPDYVEGDAAPELASMIQNLRDSLGCR